MTMIAADLARQKLSAVLAGCAEWDTGATSAVVAEGLLYYLAPTAVRELFLELKHSAGRGSRVAFSHLFSLRTYPLARASLRLGGEPWLSASTTDALEDYLGPGWDIIEARRGRAYRDLEGLAVALRR